MRPNKEDEYIKSFYQNRKSKNIAVINYNYLFGCSVLFYNNFENGYNRINVSYFIKKK